MTLIEVVILAGVQCLSPVETAGSKTIAAKVPCAVLIRLDRETGDVDFTPPAAATNPQVIAMLVKPGPQENPDVPGQIAEGDAQEPPLPPPKPARVEKASAASPAKSVERRKTLAAVKTQRRARRKDSCGSYKAVWYTNKQGRRKYRCVRVG